MAFQAIRSNFIRTSAVKSVLGSKVHPSAGTYPIQVATLRATFGEPYPYEKPWPYKTKKYTIFHEFFDNSSSRMCENSKIITVDGNLAVGKNAFAKRLAKEFDLKFVPATPVDGAFKIAGNDFDIRDLNDLLPERSQIYDYNAFLQESKLNRGMIGRVQLMWYTQKFRTYSNALQHLFHTGQGSVIVRSCYSDHVFAEAMKQCGYVTPNFLRYYHHFRDNTMCELLKPHVCIYLDAPLDTIKQRLKERNNPLELQSAALSDKYLQAVDDVYKKNFIPKMRAHSEVLEVDWSEIADDLDMDAIAAEIATLTLEGADIDDVKFSDWYKLKEDMLCWYRRRYGSGHLIREYFQLSPPVDCPEIDYPQEDWQLMHRIVSEHPAVKYEPGTAPQLGHPTLMKLT